MKLLLGNEKENCFKFNLIALNLNKKQTKVKIEKQI